MAALFTKDIYPAGEFPYLGLTGSEEAGKITAGTTFLDWDAAARGCGPHGQAGVFEHSPALSGVHRARLGTALEQGRLRGALLGERAALVNAVSVVFASGLWCGKRPLVQSQCLSLKAQLQWRRMSEPLQV